MSEEYDDPKGGEQGYEGDGPTLRYDDFVGRIVQDPNEPPSVTLLSGYLGSSSEEEHVRLYLDEELSRYVEIPEKAIRHTQELAPEQSPLGGSLVWIDSGAEVLHGAAGAERRKATFLEGQIAQDYIGGPGGIGVEINPTQSVACGGGGGGGGDILPTDMGPGCGQSQFELCIPPTVLLGCRTRTGIFCTRFGPGCRRTVFEPNCTSFGPNCRTVLIHQCQSVYYPCFTQDKFDCVESGFMGCNPIDFTIYEEQYGPHTVFEAGGAGGEAEAAQGFAAIPRPTMVCPPPTVSISCQSRLVAACFTRFPNECQFETAVRCQSRVIRCPTTDIRCQTRTGPRCLVSKVVPCGLTQVGPCVVESAVCEFDPGGPVNAERAAILPTFVCPPRTVNISCQSRLVAACFTRFPNECEFETAVRCPSRVIRCPTTDIRCQTRTGLRCQVSQIVICGTRVCEVESAVCGFDPPGGGFDPAGGGGGGGFGGGGGGGFGGGGGAEGGGAQAFAAQPLERAAGIRPTMFGCFPTRFSCPSQLVACQSQLIRCRSQLDACPTRYNCPSVAAPCVTQDFSCETRGRCPSAVDACPSRFGCYETQVCRGGESAACYPGGGGGGFDPGDFGGGGFGGGF